jgi:hypothetical protein
LFLESHGTRHTTDGQHIKTIHESATRKLGYPVLENFSQRRAALRWSLKHAAESSIGFSLLARPQFCYKKGRRKNGDTCKRNKLFEERAHYGKHDRALFQVGEIAL